MSRRSSQRPPAPEPLRVPVPDSHTHLDIVATWTDGDPLPVPAVDAESVTAELDAAQGVGVDRVVQVGCDVASSRWAVDLAEADARAWAAVALHPNEAPVTADLDSALTQIDKLAQSRRAVAVGETGMDFFRTEEAGRAAQEESFRAHIEFAKNHDLALMIHDRDAHDDVLRILDDAGAPERVVMHCFSGDAAFARECSRRRYHMSFAGNVTFKNAPTLREAVAECPKDLMLVETDAPFMTPVPYRGRRNAPYLVPATLRFLAHHLERDLDELCLQVKTNTETVFGLDSA